MLGSELKNGPDGYHYQVQGGLLLKMKLTSDTRLELIKLTRVGKEIASILPRKDDEQVLLDIFVYIQDQVTEADINVITARLPNGSVKFSMIKKIK